MRLTAKQAGQKLFKEQKVVQHLVTDMMMYFSVEEHSVVFSKHTWQINCCCQHGSLWGVNKPEEFCKHVWAVKEHLKSMEMSKNNTS